jgi:hypothetical protein
VSSDSSPSPTGVSRGCGGQIVAWLLGFVGAILVDFILSVVGGFRYGAAQIIVSWVVTVGIGFALYTLNRSAFWAFLAGYAALFLLSLLGGVTGPYQCFGTYGWPAPSIFR